MRTRVRQCREAVAFTLIEVLLAIGIFSMVMVAIYSSWSAILRGSRSGLAAAAEVQRARITIRALEESLGSCLLYADNIKYYAFFADTGGEMTYLSFVARLPLSFPGSGMFPGQELRRVTFEVDPEGTLLLRQSPVLEATELIGEPYTIKLAPQVSAFAMEFFDARTAQWMPEWLYTNQLPRMIRLALGFGKDVTSGNPQRLTMRTIPLNSIAITRIGAVGGGGVGGPLPGGAQGGNFNRGDQRGDRRGENRFSQGGGAGGRGDNRFNSGAGGRPNMNRFPPPGSFPGGGGDSEGWRPNLPSDFRQGAGGGGQRNPFFPPAR